MDLKHIQSELLKKYSSSKNFINRDLSWIEFNGRVLEEALNKNLPILDRVKFLSIFGSNLDEFYMIRISGLKEQIQANISEPSIDGLSSKETLQLAEIKIQDQLKRAMNLWNNEIIPELTKYNIFIKSIRELTDNEKEKLRKFYYDEIYPVLTPLAFDPGRPFPYISNLSLSLAVLVQNKKGEKHFARVKVPSILPRLLQIDQIINPNYNKEIAKKFKATFIWLGDLILDNLDTLFPGLEILCAHRFRVTRDTDIEIQEDEADDLLSVIEENIKQRKFGSVVRLEVEKNMPESMLETLIKNLQITREDVHILDGPIGISSIMQLYDLPVPELKEKPFYPFYPKLFEDENIFNIISNVDVLLHHPYVSFNPVIDFISAAAKDPKVLAIKQTLYRVGPNSPIVKALIEAADRGKQVAALVELKARFDEENNIYWARELEKVGAHVVYGLIGLKTHAKMTLIVRKESNGVRRYAHLSTGNYNPVTAKIYTDIGLFTSNEEICSNISDVFNYLTGYSCKDDYGKLFVAPINLNENFLKLILREIENVKNGGSGRIILKMNSLVDPGMISALYEASCNGVKIDLLIRGICCLIPGIPNLSENIKVYSIVGRFLEHSRIFYFYNNGAEEVYLSSADFMQRNLFRRVEIAFPILSEKIKRNLIEIVLDTCLKDNIKARILNSDGKYKLRKELEKEVNEYVNSQEWFMENSESLFVFNGK